MIDKNCLIFTLNTAPQPMEILHSSNSLNETEKEGIMPVTVDESHISTPIQKPSQLNQELNFANIVNVTEFSIIL